MKIGKIGKRKLFPRGVQTVEMFLRIIYFWWINFFTILDKGGRCSTTLSDQKCNRDWKGRFFWGSFEGKAQKGWSFQVTYLTSLRYLHIILPPSYVFPIYSSHFYVLCETQLLSHIIHPWIYPFQIRSFSSRSRFRK